MALATVTFSVVDAVALRPLPYGFPSQLVSLTAPSPVPGRFYPASPQDYFAWLEAAQAFESLGASGARAPLRLDVNGAVETLRTQRITTNLFDVLGVHPALGRFFGPEHARDGAQPAVILSHALWVRRFGADPGVLGRNIAFQQETREVIGVLPDGVSYPITSGSEPEAYVPYVPRAIDRQAGGGRTGFLSVVGRLRRGISVEQARADANRVAAAVVVPLQEQVAGPARQWLLLVLLAVAIVLMAACANVANLLLARATTRVAEFATREALGASRGRLAMGLLAEGVVLAMASVAAAIVLSLWGVEIARASLPPGLTRISSIAVNARVLSASIGAAMVCGLMLASAPAWFAARTDLMGVMKSSGASAGGGRSHNRALGGFLVANVAFVCVLLVATALIVTSYVLITTADLGFDRSRVMLLGFERSVANIPVTARAAAGMAARSDLLARVRSVPGVTHAAIARNSSAPMSGSSVRYSLTIPGRGEFRRDDMLETNMVTPDYFAAMGMALVRGRMFTSLDSSGAPLVMLINETAARRYFADRDPIGQVVTFRGPTTIVGVLRDIRFDGPENDARPAMFVPLDQDTSSMDAESGSLVVRTAFDPRRLTAAVREAIRPAVDGEPAQPQFLADYFSRTTAQRRFNAALMSIFGLIAVGLGALGVYGTMAFFVARQVRSIGIRMALGASPPAIMRSVLRDALRRVVLGVTLGLAASWALSNALASFVFGVGATDPAVYAAVAGLLGIVGFAAAFVPALRAARLDPLVALRHE